VYGTGSVLISAAIVTLCSVVCNNDNNINNLNVIYVTLKPNTTIHSLTYKFHCYNLIYDADEVWISSTWPPLKKIP